MHIAEVVALAYRYPSPTSAAELSAAVDTLDAGVVARHMRSFVDEVTELELGEWEELHTSTLDLSPMFIPYIGHVEWGENYRRGAFMADMNAAMRDAGIDLGGELPDHIEPVLRYLAVVDDPLDDLVEALPGTVATMYETLRKQAPQNPYCHVLAATVAWAADLRPLTIGGRS